MTYLLSVFAVGLLVAAQQSTRENAIHVDQKNLEGTWAVTSTQGFNDTVPKDQLQTLRLNFHENHITATYGNKEAEATFKLHPNQSPRQIDVTITKGPDEVMGKTFEGIYLLDGAALRIADRMPGESRPSEFNTEGKTGIFQVFCRKEKSR
jgi:uncharacterized protein (TIGR03067 family)